MTKRVTVSLPDDVAAFLDEAPNASALVAEALRAFMDRAAVTEQLLHTMGFELSEARRERMRQHLSRHGGGA